MSEDLLTVTLRTNRIERNVDVAADRVHAEDGLAVLQDLHAVAAEAADDRAPAARRRCSARRRRVRAGAEGAVLRMWVVDSDPGIDARGLGGLDLEGGEGGFVCGLGGVDGEQNGSSKQMATHDTLREDYVKCYNVTIAGNKGVLALVARPNARDARMSCRPFSALPCAGRRCCARSGCCAPSASRSIFFTETEQRMKLLSAVFLSAFAGRRSGAGRGGFALTAAGTLVAGHCHLGAARGAAPETGGAGIQGCRGGRWSSHVDIVLHDGRTMKSDGTLSLDGTPGPLSGTYGADKANLKLPAPNTLVMQLVDHDTPASTRIYTVAADRTTMTETKAFYGHDGTPILQTNLFKRIP